MTLRTITVAGFVLGTLAFAVPAAHGVEAARAGSCGEAVRSTKLHLQQAGEPTSAEDWQSVRNAAQDFVNRHPWQSPGTDALRRDINDLNRLCAA
jgi:hypothetical protein